MSNDVKSRVSEYTTERLIFVLKTINPTAINNDNGNPGEYIAALCAEAAYRLQFVKVGY